MNILLPNNEDELRRQAKSLADQQPITPPTSLDLEQAAHLIQELQVHQIELQLQNEELRRIMLELENSRQHFFVLFNQAPVGYVVLDEVGIIHQANQTFYNLVGLETDQVLQHALVEMIAEQDQDVFRARYRAFYKQPAGKIIDAEMLNQGVPAFHARMEGRILPQALNIAGRSDAHLLLTVSDVTQRVHAEDAYRHSEERFRQLAENISEVFWLRDRQSGQMVYISPAYELVWGRTRQSLYQDPRSFLDAIHPDDWARVVASRRQLQNENQPFDETYRIVRPDGAVRWIHARTHPVFNAQGQVSRYAGVARDITLEKETYAALHDSEQRYRALFATMQEGFALHEVILQDERVVDYRFLDVNPAFERLTGLRREQLIGKTVLEVMPNTESFWIEHYGEVAQSGIAQSLENYSHELGRYYQVVAYSPQKGQFATMVSDITEQKRADAALRESVQENQFLLRELQHRVKNSLALITSMVSLEVSGAAHDETIGALVGLRDRVQTLATLYNHLFVSGNTQKVDLETYFIQIVQSLQNAYGNGAREINFALACDAIEIDVKSATALGLIVNELVTNVLKHAFPADGRGHVTIKLFQQQAKLHLEISDDGVGLPEGFDPAEAEGLGMQMVSMLVQQLEGKMNITSQAGAHFEIVVPLLV